MHRSIASLSLALALGCPLFGQSVVVPGANAAVRGSAQLNSIIRNLNNPRTFMQGVNASELAGIPLGSQINGVSLRFQVFASNTSPWPPADILWNNYDIYVGPALPTAGWTGNFAANFASAPVQVRSGPMVLPANVFTNTNPVSPLPNAWAEFYFDFQVPYLYLGGDLALLFTHPGSTDPNTALYPEVVVSSAATYGVGWVQSIYPAGNAGVASNFYVMRVHYGYGNGCAGTGGRVPNLVQSGNTSGGLGGPIYMTVGNCPANTVSVFAFGFGNAQLPLPNGCHLWLAPAASLLVLVNNNGSGQYVLNVPPAVTGGFNAQAIVLDAGGPGGYTASNAISPRAF